MADIRINRVCFIFINIITNVKLLSLVRGQRVFRIPEGILNPRENLQGGGNKFDNPS